MGSKGFKNPQQYSQVHNINIKAFANGQVAKVEETNICLAQKISLTYHRSAGV